MFKRLKTQPGDTQHVQSITHCTFEIYETTNSHHIRTKTQELNGVVFSTLTWCFVYPSSINIKWWKTPDKIHICCPEEWSKQKMMLIEEELWSCSCASVYKEIQLCAALYWRPPETQSTGSTSPAHGVTNNCYTTDTNLNSDRSGCMELC